MNRILLVTLIVAMPYLAISQNDSSNLLVHIDEVTKKWDELSVDMSTYSGLQKYCKNRVYKEEVIETLNDIHHYDTVIYNVLVKKQRYGKSKDVEHALKDIKKFEAKYHPKKLVSFLHEECSFRRDIEKNKDESKTSFGAESYDGQINILETELSKFVNNIRKLADQIRKHSHHLHLEKYADE
ncbi:MAG: hypothetical protein AAFQ94_16100 [Bacteroidota bacterium]